jgi:hypothetical protein
MTNVSLSLPERSALLALMTFVDKASNPDIQARYNFTIDKKVRERLAGADLIIAYQAKDLRGAFVHELTEEGWRHCRGELTAEVPKGAQKSYRLLYGVLQCLNAFMIRSRLEMADVFVPNGVPENSPPPSTGDVEEQIQSAYDSLVSRPGGWISLTRLRGALSQVSRQDVDEALMRLDLQPQIYLIPEANQKTLTAADRKAAIHIGGEDKHLLSIVRA